MAKANVVPVVGSVEDAAAIRAFKESERIKAAATVEKVSAPVEVAPKRETFKDKDAETLIAELVAAEESSLRFSRRLLKEYRDSIDPRLEEQDRVDARENIELMLAKGQPMGRIIETRWNGLGRFFKDDSYENALHASKESLKKMKNDFSIVGAALDAAE